MLLFHVFQEVFGRILPAIDHPVLQVVLNGRLAVFIFFVLSGDALSIGYLRSKDRSVIDSLVLRRYTRLMVPVAMACAGVWVLMRAGLVFNKPAGVLVGRSDWLGAFLDFFPSGRSFVRYVLIDVFSPQRVFSKPDAQYNPMLWTMAVELPGSMLVFVFWYLSPALKRSRTLAIVIATGLTLLGNHYALFFVGVALAQGRTDGVFERCLANPVWQWAAPFIACAAALVDVHFARTRWELNVDLVVAPLMVFCGYTSRPLRSLFRSALSRWLGDISFPLYLTHFAVLVSLTSWWIVRTGMPTPLRALTIGSVSSIVAVLVACAFRPLEQRALRRVDGWLRPWLVARSTTDPARPA